jgi:hypothetical protein
MDETLTFPGREGRGRTVNWIPKNPPRTFSAGAGVSGPDTRLIIPPHDYEPGH